MTIQHDEAARGYMPSLYGMSVSLSPLLEPVPRYQLTPGLYSDEFKVEYDRWLLEFFGREHRVLVVDQQMFMHPDAWKKIAAIVGSQS